MNIKGLISLLLAAIMCIGVVGCGSITDNVGDGSDGSSPDSEKPEEKEANYAVTLACPFDTAKYDLSKLVDTGRIQRVTKDGRELEGTEVKLEVGTNVFRVLYKVSSIERVMEVRIARRDKYRVVLNANGGSYVETQYVEDCGTVNDAAVTPTRERYSFMGWYTENGEKVTLASTPIISDTTFIAHWEGPNTFELPSKNPLTYTTSSAALNIVWRDYADAFGLRPSEVTCTLKNTTTGEQYAVKVTKTSAEFVGAAPAGAVIGQGGGSWTVKITGLIGDYSFTQNALDTDNYTTVASGTNVTHTVKDYCPLYDDTAALMTMNGRFYDIAGNVVVLKGVVPWNVNQSNFSDSTSIAALERMKEEGCNVIRITMPLGETQGYTTPGKKEGYVKAMKAAVDRATELGLYCIVDWGMMYKKDADSYLKSILEPAKEFFGIMSAAYADNPYVIYELANEPSASSWAVLKAWEMELIGTVRANDIDAVIIAAPMSYSRRLSDDSAAKGKDPIDDPFPTEISYNIAHTFHCYAYTTTYNVDYMSTRKDSKGSTMGGVIYGWRVCDAVKNGLTVVITEFSPANAEMSVAGGYDSNGLDADYNEANKWLNFIFENDVNYTLFRFGEKPAGDNKIPAQFMLLAGCEGAAYKGAWTYDMLSDSGKWYYDNVLNSTGFIKAADFDKKLP